MGKDRQGKLRGGCAQCDCAEYQLPASGNACDYCGHYPTAHKEQGSPAPPRQQQQQLVQPPAPKPYYQPAPAVQQQQQQYQQQRPVQQQYYRPPPPSQPRYQAQQTAPKQGMTLGGDAVPTYQAAQGAIALAGGPPGHATVNPAGPKLVMRDTLAPSVPATAARSKRQRKKNVLESLLDIADGMTKDKHD
eukprot:TRINITY_DN2158_c0_g1_i1.p2 TRINITY_DN2158_c0_g1~~TRINITY_DN2158_c0_g1_i1.p2  ORF type:complete len:197 (+),score=68.80 TRINITY_DN2158_c0_g1_i1:22-591(+)